MNWLETLLPAALVRALGWTLVHSLWQGAVVALALAGLLLLLRRHQAEIRYRTAAVALLVLLTLAGITFVRYYTAAPTPAQSATAGFAVEDEAAVSADGSTAAATAGVVAATLPMVPAVAPAAPTGLQAWLTYFDNNIPVLVAAWLLGLLAMTLRLLGGLAYVQRLRRYRVQPLAQEWQQRLGALANKAGLKQSVQLLESALVRVPVVVGHMSPVILLPLGTVTGLSTAHLEAILAHELAHVQRRDYLMNLVQSVAETLFFYHPAVWFINACLRTERENCCDDAATALVGGNPLTVARALAALAELTAAPEPAETRLALSALGPDGSVLGRIRRLVQGRTAPTFTEGFMAACIVLGGLVLLTSAVAIADPNPASGLGTEGALKQLPFLLDEPDTTRKTTTSETTTVSLAPTPTAALPPIAGEDDLAGLGTPEAAPAPAMASAAAPASPVVDMGNAGDDDKKRKRSRQQVVVVPGPGRSRPGTVVIEKDKKGRVTNLMVDGQRVETASAGKSKAKTRKTASQVEVIQMPGSGQGWANGQNFNFNFDDNFRRSFRFPGPGLRTTDVARIKADAQRVAEDARRQFGSNSQWSRNLEQNTEVWADQAMKARAQGLKIRLQALQSAEKSLRSTLQDRDLSEQQREQLEEQLENLREQQQDAREDFRDEARDLAEQAEGRTRNGGNEDEAARRLEAEMRRHEAEMRRLEAEMHRHESEMRRNEAEIRRHESDDRRREARDSEEALLRELRKDGLIKSANNIQLSLSATSFTVNGKKQSAAVRDKYLKLVEKQTGRKLTKGSFVLNRQTSGSTVNFRGPEVPPAPPTPPSVAGVPAPPRPPRPPRAPQFNSDNIRAELRKDGIIGANEKSFQFQLNDAGLTVNGKKQSAELTEKYRRLVDAPDATGRNTHQNIQISISE